MKNKYNVQLILGLILTIIQICCSAMSLHDAKLPIVMLLPLVLTSIPLLSFIAVMEMRCEKEHIQSVVRDGAMVVVKSLVTRTEEVKKPIVVIECEGKLRLVYLDTQSAPIQAGVIYSHKDGQLVKVALGS